MHDRHLVRWAVAACFTLSCGAALADGIKPGLWEMTTQSAALTAAMAQMQQQLAAMSPEQRAQFEAMMAKNGVKIGAANVTVKLCVTPEMAKRDFVPPVQQGGQCKTTSSRSGNVLKISYTCNTQPPSTGEGEVTFVNDSSYTMTMHGAQSGLPFSMQGTGRWLAADCGDVKPLPIK